MNRSSAKILTTHIGSLPFLPGANYDALRAPERLRAFVAEVVQKQRQLGLDVINEGEYTKGGDWLSYLEAASPASRPGPPAARR